MNDEPRRRLVVAGTARYEWLDDLPGVPHDLDIVDGLFARLNYQKAEEILDHTADALRRRLAAWARAADPTDDLLVLYYAGHGERDDNGHFLMCRDSEPGQLRATAVETERVVEILAENGFTRLLLILDTCYAGQGALNALGSLAASLVHSQAGRAGRFTAFSVIASTRAGDLAADGRFAPALREATHDLLLGGQRQPRLLLEAVVERVNEILRTSAESPGYVQEAVYSTLVSGGDTAFFPNPDYVPDIPPRLDLAEARAWSTQQRRRRAERDEHFAPRGRGTDVRSGAASYFTGRTEVLRTLTGWLDDGGAGLGRCVLLTGGPGVGKSSVLGRLVLLADPAARAALDDLDPRIPPPTPLVDTAVHARRLLLEDLVAAVADAAGAPGAGRRELLAALAARTTPLVILVDALDEAGPAGDGKEARRIAREFLRALSQLPCARLLVGSRPHLAEELGSGFHRIDLDDADWSGPADVAGYARKLLLAPDGEGGTGSPYTPETAAPVAAAIAERAGHNFLGARLMARPLARRGQPLAGGVGGDPWAGQLPGQGVPLPLDEVFRWALRERMGEREKLGSGVLAALAHAEGGGLPSNEIWRTIASASLGTEVTADDLRWVLGTAGEHVVESVDSQGRSVYRLYHESYADALRRQERDGFERRLTEALIDLVPTDPATGLRCFRAADPYLRAHLATHAAGCNGVFDDLVADPQFLLAAEPVALRRVLHLATHEEAHRARGAYLRCAPVLAAETDEPQRVGQLRLAAMQEGAARLQERIGERWGDTGSWTARWADTVSAPYRAIGQLDAPVDDLAVVPLDGPRGVRPRDRRTAVVTLHPGRRLRVWDYITGEELGDLPVGPDERPLALASCGPSGPPWLLVIEDGHRNAIDVRVFDVAAGVALGPVLRTESVDVHCAAATDVDGRCVVAVAERNGVNLYDAGTGRKLAAIGGLPWRLHRTFWRLALHYEHDLLRVTAAVGGDEASDLRPRSARFVVWTVRPGRRWQVEDRREIRARGNAVRALTVLEGRAHVATETDILRYLVNRLWDRRIDRGPDLVEHWHRQESERQVICGDALGKEWWVRLGERSISVSRGRRTFELETGGPVRAWAAGPVHSDRAALVTGGDGAHLRVWDLAGAATAGNGDRRPRPDLGAACVASPDGAGFLLATGGRDGSPWYDPAGGVRTDGPRARGLCLALSSEPDLPAVTYTPTSGSTKPCTVEVWMRGGPRRIRLRRTRRRDVYGLRTTRWAGRLVLVGFTAASIEVWDDGGRRLARWGSGVVSGLRAFGTDDSLWITESLNGRSLRVQRYPHDVDSPFWALEHGPEEILSHDLGSWQGRPAVAHCGDFQVTVSDLDDRSRRASWHLTPERRVTDVWFAGARVRDLLAVATADEWLFFFAPGSAQPVAHVYVGAEIRAVLPVDGHLLAVATATGILGLELP
ncbi:AAA family ATPase [Streptomyces sp. Tue6028]|uniref:AAA family ATPase n=1 Tax=Streptomyces sp. Tue6028 TaxID=2036037 RepID=UPI003EC04037